MEIWLFYTEKKHSFHVYFNDLNGISVKFCQWEQTFIDEVSSDDHRSNIMLCSRTVVYTPYIVPNLQKTHVSIIQY